MLAKKYRRDCTIGCSSPSASALEFNWIPVNEYCIQDSAMVMTVVLIPSFTLYAPDSTETNYLDVRDITVALVDDMVFVGL